MWIKNAFTPSILPIPVFSCLAESVELETAIKTESDDELREAYELDLKSLKSDMVDLEDQLQSILLETTPIPREFETIELEIDGGIYGNCSETGLKLHQLYTSFCNHMGWDIESEDFEEIENPSGNKQYDGYQKIYMTISGENCRQFFEAERGVHKIKEFEAKKGKIFNKVFEVSLTPIVAKPTLEVPRSDLKFMATCGGGKGGMKVNSKFNKAQVTHIPTGITTEFFESGCRSLEHNQEVALGKLYAILEERMLREHEEKMLEKKIPHEIRTGNIRVYDYKEKAIMDSLTGTRVNMSSFFKDPEFLEEVGNKFIEGRQERREKHKFDAFIEKFKREEIDFALDYIES